MATEKKYLDKTGLGIFAGKVRSEINTVDGKLTSFQNTTNQALAELSKGVGDVNAVKFATINNHPIKGTDVNYTLKDLGLDDEVAIIVTTRPELSAAKYNKIYLVADADSTSTDNKFTEWIKINDGKTDKWEQIGEWQGGLTVATSVASGNNNPVSSGAVYTAINNAKPGIASASAAGLIKPGTTSGQTYGVQVDASTGAAAVTVPWTDRKLYQVVLPSNSNKAIPLIGSGATAGGQAAEGIYLADLTYNLSTHMLKLGGGLTAGEGIIDAAKFNGVATTAMNDVDNNPINTTYLKVANFNTKFSEATDLLPVLSSSDIEDIWAAAAPSNN